MKRVISATGFMGSAAGVRMGVTGSELEAAVQELHAFVELAESLSVCFLFKYFLGNLMRTGF